ncbi:MAG: hypothetical protein ACTSPK_00960 [Candidatus Heimdallarchaeota archaeon]
MKNKVHLITSFLILNLIIISLGNVSGAVVWIYWDDVDDVEFFDNSIPQYDGDYHDEIDIIRADLNGSNIVFQFQATPIDDADHIYYLDIYWTQYAGFNSTSAIFGMGNNVMATYLHNSVGQNVASSVVQDSIVIGGYYLLMPIPIFAQIPGTADPYYIQLQSIAVTGQDLYFQDYRNGTDFSDPTSTGTPVLTIPFLSVIVVVCIGFVILKKKKN